MHNSQKEVLTSNCPLLITVGTVCITKAKIITNTKIITNAESITKAKGIPSEDFAAIFAVYKQNF
jgi:hypothetical protein